MEMQVKATMQYQYACTRAANIKKTNNIKGW